MYKMCSIRVLCQVQVHRSAMAVNRTMILLLFVAIAQVNIYFNIWQYLFCFYNFYKFFILQYFVLPFCEFFYCLASRNTLKSNT